VAALQLVLQLETVAIAQHKIDHGHVHIARGELADRLPACREWTDDLGSFLGEAIGIVEGDDGLVLDKKDAGPGELLDERLRSA
jgi:hypothetical protein